MEPIFEADFEDCSFGFRPKRDAHQAVGTVRAALSKGQCFVIDADLQQYFDSIAHDKLLKVIARRISDRHILSWIKQWLKAPVVEEDVEGKRRTRKAERGTPQGGVISPLLANIYLHLFDRAFLIAEPGGSKPIWCVMPMTLWSCCAERWRRRITR